MFSTFVHPVSSLNHSIVLDISSSRHPQLDERFYDYPLNYDPVRRAIFHLDPSILIPSRSKKQALDAAKTCGSHPSRSIPSNSIPKKHNFHTLQDSNPVYPVIASKYLSTFTSWPSCRESLTFRPLVKKPFPPTTSFINQHLTVKPPTTSFH